MHLPQWPQFLNHRLTLILPKFFNARSILPKIDELHSLCATLQPTAIVVSEIWLSLDVLDNEVLINGYNLVRKDRNHHGRGVAIYISSALPFKRLHFPHSKDLELMLVECLLNSWMLTIAGLYQPLNVTSEVLEKLHVLSSLWPQNFSNLVLCRDFYIQPTKNRLNNSLSHLQSDFQLTQVVNEPTSISQSSSSIIDLIFLSNPNTSISYWKVFFTCRVAWYLSCRVPQA